jgi:hypothetical protein
MLLCSRHWEGPSMRCILSGWWHARSLIDMLRALELELGNFSIGEVVKVNEQS